MMKAGRHHRRSIVGPTAVAMFDHHAQRHGAPLNDGRRRLALAA
jgi:hypothetical protein